ncbi:MULTISPECIES: F0F1 ATP synthase subunit A [Flammeovirga]|uniref:ATP synthase subunit a n=1 Tax=Flammeovirga agarivorans TaxID=2726742 RepID=A0A7X8SGC0_9BACT|nr:MULTISPECIES: F0F1 ATP synthase subunit A [Flammeovirga]NLR89706.1 F0F1 ATP synthase subunit A [Flammeovirga agarivorans]
MKSNLSFYRRLAMLAVLLTALVQTSSLQASDGHGEPHDGEHIKEYNPVETILHHVKDEHYWTFYSTTDDHGHEHHYGINLPVILYVEGKGFEFFGSSEFLHHKPVKGKFGSYENHHEHISSVDGDHIYDLSLTKNAASTGLSVLLLIIIFSAISKGYKNNAGKAPSGIQSFFEPLIVYMRDEVIKPNLGHNTDRFLPYLLTLFFFILFNNLLGLLPGGANASGNISFTMLMAIFTLIITNINGNKEYWGHIFATPGVPGWLLPIMIPVEIIGIFTKPIALMLRLFANITGGHIVLLSFMSLVFILEAAWVGGVASFIIVPLYFMEIFVAFLQAYIFTMLSALFIGSAVAEHH